MGCREVLSSPGRLAGLRSETAQKRRIEGMRKTIKETDEPRRHPVFMTLLGLACLATVPWPFVGLEPVLWLGVPVWLWWSLGWTVVVSGLTVWGVLAYWRDDELE